MIGRQPKIPIAGSVVFLVLSLAASAWLAFYPPTLCNSHPAFPHSHWDNPKCK